MKLRISTLTILAIACALMLTTTLQAQVTIGSSSPPVEGSLLDLKEQPNGTSLKGLGLPRVKLTAINAISDISNATGKEIEHVGLLVYNTNECLNSTGKDDGLYVWDGTMWEYVGKQVQSSDVKTFTDNRLNDTPQTYKYRSFGAQGDTDYAGEWMIESLRATRLPDGTALTFSAAGSQSIPQYAYPAPNPSPNPLPAGSSGLLDGTDEYYVKKVPSMGYLYNWVAAANGNTSNANQAGGEASELTVGNQGICPAGWHLPSDKEWNDLERHIYKNAHLYSSYTAAEVIAWNNSTPWNPAWDHTSSGSRPSQTTANAYGAAIKSSCSPIGSNVNPKGKSLSNFQGGFSILLIGYAYGGQVQAYTYGYGGSFWSSSSAAGTQAWYRNVDSTYSSVYQKITNKETLFPVRCKKN